MPVNEKVRKAVKKTEMDVERGGRKVRMEAKKGAEDVKKGAKKLRKKI